jgi:hypothetical protein
MRPGIIRKCESMDFKPILLKSKTSSDFSRTRNCSNYHQDDYSKILGIDCIDPYRDHRGDKLCEHRRHTYNDNPKDSWYELENNIKSNMLKSQKKRDTVNNKYLSKLANLPLLGLNNHKNFITHDNNNNKNVMEKEEENGRTFYL